MVDGDGIGRRIATYRRRRGLSQAAWLVWSVAQNLGFRKSNVEFVLLTECHCCWISLACYTSRSIRLIGRPWQLAPNGNTIAGGLSDVRAVLTSYNSLLARPSVQVSDLTELRSKVAEVHRTYQAARYDDVVTALPGVLAAVEGFPGRKNGERREALLAYVSAYAVAAKLVTKLGAGDLALLAADRAATAAVDAESRSARGMAGYQVACALRALLWSDVDLLGRPDLKPPVPPSMAVWRSVRATGDTKTKRSRRTLALPARCVDVLSEHSRLQARMRAEAGAKWVDLGLVFTTRYGTPLDSADVRRDFRAAIGRAAGVDARQWTPRELRHSFVSLLSDSGVPIEEISRLVGHRSTVVTEVVYRKQLRPVLESGATVMDRLFAAAKDEVGGQFGGQDPSGTDEPGSLAEGTGL